jgi:hypothetical protein
MRTERASLLGRGMADIGAYAGYLMPKEAQHALMGTPVIPLNFTVDRIPLDHTREVLQNDPFLSMDQKGQALAIIDNTGYNTKTGKASASDLAAGAIRAGFGLAGGAVAGYVLGSLFALPTAVTRSLSLAGGVAGALINTGVVKCSARLASVISPSSPRNRATPRPRPPGSRCWRWCRRWPSTRR